MRESYPQTNNKINLNWSFCVTNPNYPAGQAPDRWRTLLVIAIAQLMVVLDSSIVNIAIPSAKADLGITDANQQWVITAYTLAFGSLLLLGGRIADFVGRKKIFIIGLLGFAGASALGGIAHNQELLFASRALQGVFGALLAPAALSIVSVTFTDPKERARAFGVYGAISGGGAAIGLILGGALTEYFSWRWCLGVNTPIAIAAALLALKYVHESKAGGDHSYDLPGVFTASAGLFALVYGFNEAARKGWSDSMTLTFLGVAVVLLAAFVLIETKVTNPLMPMRVVTERNRGGSYLGSLVVGAGLFSMFLFLGLYLQTVLGYTPLRSGFAFLPFTAGIIVFAGVASQLLPKFGPKPLMVPGLVAAAVGLLLLTRITPETSYVTHVLPSLLIMSSGMALVFIPLSTTSLHGVGNRDAGVASALLNTSQQVGGSLGTALLNTIAATAATSYMTSNPDKTPPFGITHGFTVAFTVSAALLLVGAVVLFFFINIGKEAVVETEGAIAH
ncbi:MAG: DHA2 family efflux MFS transporter permease subunit [Actinobacteria bacterium]|nr:DHA2 family efflux MFS transporter permease subunit [Actinomycetota bacterium]